MSNAKVSWHPSTALEIRYTGSIHGNLDKLPYLATVIKQQRSSYPDMLLFDTGSFSGPNVPGPLKGKPHVDVYNHLQYDGVVPGRAEAMDTAALKAMARAAKFPFLASNWKGMGEGDFFVRSKVIERAGETLILMGMAAPDPTPLDTEYVDPCKAMDELLKDFKPTDVVVVILSQLDGNQNLALASHNKFTKVIVSGLPVKGVDQAMQVGNSIIAPAAEGPDGLGSLHVDLAGSVQVDREKKEGGSK